MSQRTILFFLLGVIGLLFWNFWNYEADTSRSAERVVTAPPLALVNTGPAVAPAPKFTAAPIASPHTAIPPKASQEPVLKTKTPFLPASFGVVDTEALRAAAEQHPDSAVRLQALERLLEEGVIPTQAWLEHIFQTDASEQMRVEAFRVLTESSEADTATIRAMLTAALSDSSAVIRDRAQTLLTDMASTAAHAVPVQGAAENTTAR